jgi:YidC/Oxa1 family membrane protein insertase
MYQNQPDPKVIAAEKAQKELIKEAKAKELNDKVVAEATVAAVAATGDSTLSKFEKSLKLLILLHYRQPKEVLLLLKMN